MGILNIKEAERSGSRVVIGIAGASGSGKTYTALKIGEGMVSDTRKIGFLDTENRRGSLNADILNGPFMIADLYAPFSPKRYADAIKEFQAAGVEVLVVDSGSHEWEGDGGCEDIAYGSGGKMANWKLAKAENKKFMRALLQSDMHIIITLRAREKTDFSNPKQPKSLGMQPICEKNLMFELTASMMMWNEGRQQQFLKMPEALRTTFGDGNNYIGPEAGRALVDWVNSGVKVDKEVSQWESRLQMSTDNGTHFLREQWALCPPHIQKQLKHTLDQLKASAQGFDEIAQAEAIGEAPNISAQGGFNPQQQAKPEMVSQAVEQDNQPTTDSAFN
jgi:hypothetical protein